VKKAIEEGFPIVEINRLAVPERNSFKPIYQMHKWFARRASCVFRAILLGCLKPAGTDIMAEFYKDHSDDPDTAGKVILDPFMGGGTTVVEALRLGCKVIGIDLNPVAWFIVKTEVEPVDLDALRATFERLANRSVPWSGKSVRETLLDQYKTTCPCCGSSDADIVYTFWVRSAVCTAANCRKEVPLHRDFIVAQKSLSIRYWRDARCPRCTKTFDWEIEQAVLVAEVDLQVTNSEWSDVNRAWAFSERDDVECPWCRKRVRAVSQARRPERKKVMVTALLCPRCESVWQWRGDVANSVTCPVCHHKYSPNDGTLPDDYDFICFCSNRSGILGALKQLPVEERLLMRSYAIAGYCSACASVSTSESKEDLSQEEMFEANTRRHTGKQAYPDHLCGLTKGRGRFFSRVTVKDVARYQAASELWQRWKSILPHPTQDIPYGY